MKKNIILLTLQVLIFQGLAQITIISSDMPYVPCTYYPVSASIAGFSNPIVGANMVWNYSSLVSSQNYQFSYLIANSTLYPDATIKDTSLSGTIIPGRVYYYTGFFKKTNDYFAYLGNQVFEQRYSIATVTGGVNDSAIFPVQHYPAALPVKSLVFPMTVGTNWNSIYVDVINFNLTIAAVALNNAPSTKKSYILRNDSIIGWGSLIVPTLSGPSLPAEVLMMKRISIVTDSFFIAGNPAPAALLANFGLSQGQQTITNRYLFWRKFAVYPLLVINYGSNNFTSPSSVFYDGMASNVGVVYNQKLDISLYPNPANEYLKIDLKNSNNIYKSIEIYSIQGVRIKKLESTDIKEIINISELESGIYFIRLNGNNVQNTYKFIKK